MSILCILRKQQTIFHHNKNSQNQFCFCQREKIKSFICTIIIKRRRERRRGRRGGERNMRGRRKVIDRYGVFLFTWSRWLDLAWCSYKTYIGMMLYHPVLANKFNCHLHVPLCCNIHVIWHPPPTHPAPTTCMKMLVVVFVLLSSSRSRRRCAFHMKKTLHL